MELYLIRHAQSVNNLIYAETQSDQGRVEDPELTELGLKQAAGLADFLAQGFTFTHLYTSLMVRAVATADAIGRRLQLRPVAWPEVHERMGVYLENRESGVWEGRPGKSRTYFENRFPDLVLPDTLNEHGWWNRPVETQDQWARRARTFWTELKLRHSAESDRVAIVSHGGFYHEIICALFDIPTDSSFWFRWYNTAISRIDWEGDLVNVSYLNRIDHLSPDLVS